MKPFKAESCNKAGITHCFISHNELLTVKVFGSVQETMGFGKDGNPKCWKLQSWWFEIWLNGEKYNDVIFDSLHHLSREYAKRITTERTAKKMASLAFKLISKAFNEENRKLIWWIKQCGMLDENYHHLPDNIGEKI